MFLLQVFAACEALFEHYSASAQTPDCFILVENLYFDQVKQGILFGLKRSLVCLSRPHAFTDCQRIQNKLYWYKVGGTCKNFYFLHITYEFFISLPFQNGGRCMLIFHS